jgi:hypothetical protein
MGETRLDVYWYRPRLNETDGWHFVYGQNMRSRWHPGVKAVTLCNRRDRPAVDLEVESQIPSEAQYSIHNEPAECGTSFCKRADRNPANETGLRKGIRLRDDL